MNSVERLSITLPSAIARLIRAKVEEGRYASDSDLIGEAMQVWQEREQVREQRLATFRAKIDEADADPRQSLSDDQIGEHFAERLRASLSAKD